MESWVRKEEVGKSRLWEKGKKEDYTKTEVLEIKEMDSSKK